MLQNAHDSTVFILFLHKQTTLSLHALSTDRLTPIMHTTTPFKELELFVFDIAGTTLNHKNEVNACFENTLEAHNIPIDREHLNSIMGYKKRVAIQMALAHQGLDDEDKIVDKIHDEFLASMNHYYETSSEVEAEEGITEVFEFLRAHDKKIALDTGFSRSTAEIIIHRVGWDAKHYIDAFIGSDEVPQGRPAPHMIHHLMKECGVQDVLNVAKTGDTPSDLLEGKEAGVGLNVGVTYGTHTKDELSVYKHDLLIGHPSELIDYLKNHE